MTRHLAVISLALVCVSCASTMLPQRYPSHAPAAMAAAQADADQQSCLDAAERATAERAWTYIGCLVSKGHTVAVAFHVRGEPAYMYVTQTKPHTPMRVEAELSDCRVKAYAAGRAGTKDGRDAMVQRMESSFRACIDGHGYTVERVMSAPAVRR